MRAVTALASVLFVAAGLAGPALAGHHDGRHDDWRDDRRHHWRHDHRWDGPRVIGRHYPPPVVIERPVYPVAALPEHEIFRRVAAQGYRPIAHLAPVPGYFRVEALDPYNRPVALLVRPHTGEIAAVTY